MDCLKLAYADVLRDMMKAVCARHLILNDYFTCQYDSYDDNGLISYAHCFYYTYWNRYWEMLEEHKFAEDDIVKFNDECLDNEKWYDLNKLVELIEQDNCIVEGIEMG